MTIQIFSLETIDAPTGRMRIITDDEGRLRSVDWDDHEARMMKLFRQLCSGVAHAHHRGVIHRDLKPTNILVAKTEKGPVVKVIDFGIAMLQTVPGRGVRRTQQGQVLGTLGYMAPEQIETGAADTRSDCYSLGAVLYEMLSGKPAVPS